MCYVEFCIIDCGTVNLVNLYIVYEVILSLGCVELSPTYQNYVCSWNKKIHKSKFILLCCIFIHIWKNLYWTNIWTFTWTLLGSKKNHRVLNWTLNRTRNAPIKVLWRTVEQSKGSLQNHLMGLFMNHWVPYRTFVQEPLGSIKNLNMEPSVVLLKNL